MSRKRITLALSLLAWPWLVVAANRPVPPPAPPPQLVELKTGKFTFVEGSEVKLVTSGSVVKNGDTFAESMEVDTGAAVATEITFEDGSVIRLGEKTKASFVSKERLVRLEHGVILFYSPEGNGGISIHGGGSSGRVTGSSVMSVRDSAGNFSFFILESSGTGSVSGPSTPATLIGVGEGTTIRTAGGKTPEVMNIHVDAIRDISPLFQQIPNPFPGSEKVVSTTRLQADEIQGNIKLLSSLDDYKLVETDPEGISLAMACGVTQNEMGAAKNILLRPMDTASGTEVLPQESGSIVAVSESSAVSDARQSEAEPIIAASTPPPSEGGVPSETETAAGGGSAPDSQAPLPPVNSSPTPGFTTQF